MSENLSIGLTTTGLGLLVVFTALIFLIIIITIMSIFSRTKTKKEQPVLSEPTNAQPTAEVVQDTVNEEELIAVLTAAAAYAMRGDESSIDGLVVRSYRKVEGESAWSQAGRNAQIFNKF